MKKFINEFKLELICAGAGLATAAAFLIWCLNQSEFYL